MGLEQREAYTDILVSMRGHVGVVEIDRPPHNFFDFSLIAQIADAFEAIDADPDVRAIVLCSKGKAFCAGANFSTATDNRSDRGDFSEAGFTNTTDQLYAEGLRLFRCATPIVAAIQGPAIGGGLGVALVADFRVAAPEARFAANFVKLGLHQGFGISVTLPRVVGAQQAALMLLTGRRLNAAAALANGLVDKIVPAEQLREAAIEQATEIAENAPLAVVSVRTTLRIGLTDAIASATDHEGSEQAWLRRTNDAAEGIRAVAERRPGNFTAS